MNGKIVMKVLSSINSSFITEDYNSQGNLYEILMGTFLFFLSQFLYRVSLEFLMEFIMKF